MQEAAVTCVCVCVRVRQGSQPASQDNTVLLKGATRENLPIHIHTFIHTLYHAEEYLFGGCGAGGESGCGGKWLAIIFYFFEAPVCYLSICVSVCLFVGLVTLK